MGWDGSDRGRKICQFNKLQNCSINTIENRLESGETPDKGNSASSRLMNISKFTFHSRCQFQMVLHCIVPSIYCV